MDEFPKRSSRMRSAGVFTRATCAGAAGLLTESEIET
jgi:hypothetical protein